MTVMQVSAALILLAVGVYGLIHSWLASLQAKALARRAYGPGVDRIYRLAYNGFAIVSLLPVLALPALLPDRRLWAISYPWSLITLAIQAAAGLALVIGVLQTGIGSFVGLRQLFQQCESSTDRFVVSGLYGRVRHPLYTAGLVLIWLTPVMTVNLFALNLGLSAYLLIGAWFEERKLLQEFGDDYQMYRRRTPMFFPKLFR